jgi:hypothetical protein
MPRKKNKPEQSFPGVNESMADYLKSEIYRESFKTITISSFEEQEESNYEFWAHLTPRQRIELHYHMITGFFADELKQKKKYNKIEFDTIQ